MSGFYDATQQFIKDTVNPHIAASKINILNTEVGNNNNSIGSVNVKIDKSVIPDGRKYF